MTQVPVNSKIAVISAGEPTLFDSLARLVPEELQAAYYRVLAHTRTLSPDDEMLRILEAMGILALLTRHTPKDIADERERFQEMLSLHEQLSDEAQRRMLAYVRELDSRIFALPGGIEASLDPKKIAKLLGESLRQHFLQTGIPATAKGLQATGEALAAAQKEFSTTLRNLLDSQNGVVAQVDSANRRLTYSLEHRANAVDGLLHELRNDVLRIWIPLIVGASLLIGLFSGMGLQGWRDSNSAAAATPASMAARALSVPEAEESPEMAGGPAQEGRRQEKAKVDLEHER
jgi:predicted secreted protein